MHYVGSLQYKNGLYRAGGKQICVNPQDPMSCEKDSHYCVLAKKIAPPASSSLTSNIVSTEPSDRIYPSPPSDGQSAALSYLQYYPFNALNNSSASFDQATEGVRSKTAEELALCISTPPTPECESVTEANVIWPKVSLGEISNGQCINENYVANAGADLRRYCALNIDQQNSYFVPTPDGTSCIKRDCYVRLLKPDGGDYYVEVANDKMSYYTGENQQGYIFAAENISTETINFNSVWLGGDQRHTFKIKLDVPWLDKVSKFKMDLYGDDTGIIRINGVDVLRSEKGWVSLDLKDKLSQGVNEIEFYIHAISGGNISAKLEYEMNCPEE